MSTAQSMSIPKPESIIHVIHIITCLENGGAEGALFRLIEASPAHITHQVISLSGPGIYTKPLEKLGVNVDVLNMPKGRISISGLKLLTTLLRQSIHPNAVVQTWMYHADLLGGTIARLVGHRKIFWGIRNTKLDPSARATKVVAKTCAWLSRWVPNAIVCCSTNAAKYHRALGYQAPMTVIYNGYDLEKLKILPELNRNTRESLEIDEAFTLGFVARWDPIKDHENLMHGLKLWRKQNPVITFNLVLVGYGCDSANTELIQLLNHYGLTKRTYLLGQREDIAAIMNMLDLHVLSSKSEAFPNTIAEAMACGTPCLTTNVGDAAYIVGTTGWVVPPQSPTAISEGLQSAFSIITNDNRPNTDCRERIAELFSLQSMVDEFQLIWSTEKRVPVVNNKNPPV